MYACLHALLCLVYACMFAYTYTYTDTACSARDNRRKRDEMRIRGPLISSFPLLLLLPVLPEEKFTSCPSLSFLSVCCLMTSSSHSPSYHFHTHQTIHYGMQTGMAIPHQGSRGSRITLLMWIRGEDEGNKKTVALTDL